MAKLDRLGWTAGFVFESFGLRVGVRASDARVLERVRAHLPPGWRVSSRPTVERLYSVVASAPSAGAGEGRVRRLNLLYGDINRLARTRDLDELFDAFESDLQLYVAAAAPRRVFVHAGVVGWRGRAILLPGRSFTGKSTLVAELVRAGASYYSDEYAVLDARGRVHPFARPLSLRQGKTGRQKKLEDLPGARSERPLPVGLVVMSQYRADARWRPRQLSRGQGMLALLSNTVSARQQPALALETLQRATEHAPVLRGVRGEAGEVAASILESLKREETAGISR